MRNIELKARCGDLDLAAQHAEALGARFAGMLAQTDTYFVVPHGRLKLRETTGKPAELIGYRRDDSVSFRPSDYHRTEISQPAELKNILGESLGFRLIVRKRRRLYLWENVRIHLDDVENLGQFIEFEAVIGPDVDEATSKKRLALLCEALKIADADRIAVSYVDLMT